MITEERGVRYLHIGGGAIQSAMRLSAPDALELHYTRAMMSFLLFQPDPRAVLMVGLGGGSMAKFLYRRFPAAKLVAVELDPRVAQAAWEQFGLPPADERLEVVIDDGARYLAGRDGVCDVLLLDAFDDGDQVPSLTTPEFYARAHDALQPGGVLAANFMTGDRKFEVHLEHIREAFGARVLTLPALDRINTIVLGLRDGPARVAIDALKARAQALKDALDLPLDRLFASLVENNDRTAQYLRTVAK